MDELRAATWPAHQRLEKRLDIKARFGSLPLYRGHLEQMWGFCAALEPRLEPWLRDAALPDCESRSKLPLLTHDLLALGVNAAALAHLPRCAELPDCPDSCAALGCLYVLEGATLGGRTLLPMVQVRLGLTAQHGASFLASYGADVRSMWQRFGSALDAWCAAAEQRSRATAAAVATFGALERWLCGRTA
jgi:heme oxygenase